MSGSVEVQFIRRSGDKVPGDRATVSQKKARELEKRAVALRRRKENLKRPVTSDHTVTK